MPKAKPIITVIGIQDACIAKVNAARAKWAHRPDGGHSQRSIGAAYKRARRELEKLGLSLKQINVAVNDAKDMADLIYEFGEVGEYWE